MKTSEKLTTNTQGIDITGHTETDTLNVSGVSTFVETVKASDRLEVDGVTDSDELTVTGVSTFSGQVGFTTHVDILDDVRLRIGNDQDLEIFHNSSNNNTIIQETTGGNLVIKGSNLFLQSANGEDFFKGDADGAVELYYDDSKKFETTGIGVSILSGID